MSSSRIEWRVGGRYEAMLTSGDVVLGTVVTGARIHFRADDGRTEAMSHIRLIREVSQ